ESERAASPARKEPPPPPPPRFAAAATAVLAAPPLAAPAPAAARPPAPAPRRAGEEEIAGARRLMSEGRFDAAPEILDRAYAPHPADESLRRLPAEAEAAFIEKAYRYVLPPAKVVSLSRPVGSLTAETLSPTEYFLLSRIDNATWDVRSIIQITPLREIDVLRTFK